jgi:hypothetical protein
MLQQIDCDHLIKGEIYYITHNFLERKENLLFDGNSFFKYSDSNYSFQLHLRMNTFYRYITKEEYYTKLKEKYDSTCLNIILKRLIDEYFEYFE